MVAVLENGIAIRSGVCELTTGPFPGIPSDMASYYELHEDHSANRNGEPWAVLEGRFDALTPEADVEVSLGPSITLLREEHELYIARRHIKLLGERPIESPVLKLETVSTVFFPIDSELPRYGVVQALRTYTGLEREYREVGERLHARHVMVFRHLGRLAQR